MTARGVWAGRGARRVERLRDVGVGRGGGFGMRRLMGRGEGEEGFGGEVGGGGGVG